jgi:amino acid adenylation domain-containing protein
MQESRTSLVDLLRQRAADDPGRTAFTFLADGEREAARLSRGELDRAARAVGAALRDAGCTGERALLLFPQGLEFVTAFWGCIYGGAVAVPAYPPRGERGLPRLRAMAADARPRAVLTTRALRDEVRPFFGAEADALAWIAVDDLPEGAGGGWTHPGGGPGTLAFLQYTSGSTGTPRGVMVSHGNLLHNLRLLAEGWRQGEDAVVVSWLPLFHDMGLIGNVLEAVHLGAPCVLMPPAAFLQRPFRWLDAVSRHGATLSGGPNFAYELAARRITPEQRAGLDLSRWSAAFNGAEPVRRDTLERFYEAFAPCGLRREALIPGYGLAEATLVVSSGHGGAGPTVAVFDAAGLEAGRLEEREDGEPETRALAGCGRVVGGQEVAIVDPETRRGCEPGRVGEIWLRGPSVAGGYWERPEESEETFRAVRADTGEGPFLRTGDLGFVHGGELFVAGRLRDLVIVRGRNHYPQDLELTAERAHPAVRAGCGAAFTLEVAGEERLVVACELERTSVRGDAAPVAAAIRQALVEEHDLPPHRVVLLRPGAVPKTTSGKIQRRGCRAALLAGELEVVFDWAAAAPVPEAEAEPVDAPAAAEAAPDAARIRDWLVARIAERVGIGPGEVDPRAPFARWGLDSLAAVALSGELQDWLGRPLPPTLLYDHPSVDRLARALAGDPADTGPARPGRRAGRREMDEPVAIVGMGCRFPGADGPEAFWRLLMEGVDAVREVPAERWDVERLYDADVRAPGRMTTRWGGFVEGVDRFDAAFFGISPREAARIDPQQRLLLEVAWEALEDAGIDPDRLAGTDTGVFVGISTSDYGQMQLADPSLTDAYAGTGGALSIAANRLSYLLDLRGPSMAVDTACSSSLVAVHLAVASLRAGECDQALVGGANLLLAPQVTVNFSKAGFMSPDGRCRAFDARANGYVRAEGAGAVVLKPLSRARADGDPVYAVIRGTAVGQDGRSNGLTAPSQDAQAAVLRSAYAAAGVDPRRVAYVEAHGTGTALGDPIEARALGSVLGAERAGGEPCRIGSVKTNLGHLEAAAGIAGLLKAALALRHGRIPASLHFQSPNPAIPFTELGLRVQAQAGEWPAPAGARVAGVSSFGFGGTNAHVVLADAPVEEGAPASPALPVLVPLSARDAGALRQTAARMGALLASDGAPPLGDVAYTASLRRAHHDHRLAVVAASPAEAAERLGDFAAGSPHPGLAAGRAVPGRAPRVGFVFSGQGPQWWAMGRELLRDEPVFRRAVAAVDEAVRAEAGWSVLDALGASEEASRMADTSVAQPAIFALQAGLAALWASWGIHPYAVAGHSVGEVAAAYLGGALPLEEAARVIVRRGREMHAATGMGTMAAVGLADETAREVVAPYGDRLAVAAFNAPGSTVLSGETAALEEVLAGLEARDVFVRRMTVNYAFHSAQTAPAAERLAAQLAGLAPHPDEVPFFSTVEGAKVDGRALDAAYWGRNVRQPVRFAAAVQAMAAAGCDAFVEVGPHPVLSRFVEQTLAAAGTRPLVVPSLRRGEGEREGMLGSLAGLYAQGAPVDWAALHPAGGRVVSLPRYPWQRERHWMEPVHGDASVRPGGGPHPLLGGRMELADRPGTHVFPGVADRTALARLGAGDGTLSLPLLRELVASAAADALGAPCTVDELRLDVPLVVNGTALALQASVAAGPGQGLEVRVHARPASDPRAPWTLHAVASARPSPPEAVVEDAAPAAAPPPTRDEVAAAEPAERPALLERHLRGRIGAVLRIAAERVDPEAPLTMQGLDSLMALEVKNAVERDLRVSVPLRELLGGASVRGLGGALLARLAAPATADARGGAGEDAADGAHPLSYAQRPMWLLGQLDPESPLFNVFAAMRIVPGVDAPALRRALGALVRRHPALRTALAARDGRPVQVVAGEVEVALPVTDAAGWGEAALRRALEDEAHRPFELERAPLLRAALYRRGPGEDVLLLAMHHAAVDFWSNVVLLGDLAALYAAEAGGAPAVLGEPGNPYTAFARWQERQLAGAEGEQAWGYWRERLAGASPHLALPADRRPGARTGAGAVHRFHLDGDLTRRVHAFARERQATPYTVLLAAWHALLARWTGQDDVLVATPMAARGGAAWEATVGCFMNLVLLRGELGDDPSFDALLGRTRESVLGALQHQEYPLHLLAERLPALRGSGRGEPAGAMFVFNRPHRMEEDGIAGVMTGEPGARFHAGGLVMEALPLDERTTPCDLCLWACEAGGGLSMRLQYAADLFHPDSAARMAGQLAALLDAVLRDPARPVSRAPMLGAGERAAVLAGGAGEDGAALRPLPVHRAFEAQAARTPDAPAVEGGGETVGYAELDARANRLAHHLLAAGVTADAPVGVCLERSPELIVALLAVLKAGAAYLPLDPAYPEERLERMLADAGVRVLVTRAGRTPGGASVAPVRVDADRAAIAAHPPHAPGREADGESLAYVIYTSGSTGRPKGTMVRHAGLANHTASAADAYGIGPADRVLQFASASFDASAEEIYPALARGAALVLRPEWAAGGAADFLAWCGDAGITVLDLPTAFWHVLAAALAAGEAALPPCVRLVIIGGERALPERVAEWRAAVGDRCRLVNTYGPTEATIVATRHEVAPEDGGAREVPIGRPIHGTTARVLDGAGEPVPPGVVGELFLGGAGVARGYLRRPGQTAERFVPDPHAGVPGARMYATGDRARRRGDGTLEFAGRVDGQVKVRGYRIEPGEVEAVLREHPDVAEAAVAAPETAPGERRLVAYVAARRGPAPSARELRDFARELLPEHMVPSAWVFLPALPRTAGGKVDRRALPAPGAAGGDAEGAVAPRTPLEARVAEVCAAVLGRERVGVHDDFFELGGDSILAMQLVSRARRTGLPLHPRQVFAYTTVARLAAVLGEVPVGKADAAPATVPLGPGTLDPLRPGPADSAGPTEAAPSTSAPAAGEPVPA